MNAILTLESQHTSGKAATQTAKRQRKRQNYPLATNPHIKGTLAVNDHIGKVSGKNSGKESATPNPTRSTVSPHSPFP